MNVSKNLPLSFPIRNVLLPISFLESSRSTFLNLVKILHQIECSLLFKISLRNREIPHQIRRSSMFFPLLPLSFPFLSHPSPHLPDARSSPGTSCHLGLHPDHFQVLHQATARSEALRRRDWPIRSFEIQTIITGSHAPTRTSCHDPALRELQVRVIRRECAGQGRRRQREMSCPKHVLTTTLRDFFFFFFSRKR